MTKDELIRRLNYVRMRMKWEGRLMVVEELLLVDTLDYLSLQDVDC